MTATTRFIAPLLLIVGVFYVTGCARAPQTDSETEAFPEQSSIDSEAAFKSIAEVEPSAAELALKPTNSAALAKLTPEFFISQCPSFGFQTSGLTEAKTLFDRRKDFNREFKILSQGGHRPLVAYYVLFKSTADAARFVLLRHDGLAQYDRRGLDTINSLVNVCRRENFVAIFVSDDESMRIGYPKQRWHIADENMNL